MTVTSASCSPVNAARCMLLLYAAGPGLSNGPVDLCRSGGVMGNPESLLVQLLIHTDVHTNTQTRMRSLAGPDTG